MIEMVNMKSHRTDTLDGKLSPKIAINIMKCHKCGTVYHWGVEGMGNCPSCRKKSKKKVEQDG